MNWNLKTIINWWKRVQCSLAVYIWPSCTFDLFYLQPSCSASKQASHSMKRNPEQVIGFSQNKSKVACDIWIKRKKAAVCLPRSCENWSNITVQLRCIHTSTYCDLNCHTQHSLKGLSLTPNMTLFGLKLQKKNCLHGRVLFRVRS